MNTETTEFTAELGADAITILSNGEDVDLVNTPDGVRPAILHCEPSEEWEPEVYDEILADEGWRRTTEWAGAGNERYHAQVVRAS
jgi:hypothetical protein